MNIIKEKNLAGGAKEVSVRVEAGETLLVIRENAMYQLGEPLEESVLPGNMLINSNKVTWCPIEQKWV